jgi:hypothetical protein
MLSCPEDCLGRGSWAGRQREASETEIVVEGQPCPGRPTCLRKAHIAIVSVQAIFDAPTGGNDDRSGARAPRRRALKTPPLEHRKIPPGERGPSTLVGVG